MTKNEPEFGRQPPHLMAPPPGPISRAMAGRLRRVESRNVTWVRGDFPVFWEEARGANVRDVDGNVYLDLTAAFGVALLGHGSPEVHAAVTGQADRLVHGMGDVHPPTAKLQFLEALVELLKASNFNSDHGLRVLLGSSGSDAVEAALKTAHLATGRAGVVAFRGGYHGLTLGALSATARDYFRAPFLERIPDHVAWADFPTSESEVDGVLARVEHWFAHGLPDGAPVGAVIVEPVQARGGVRIPAPEFGRRLSDLARKYGVVLVADEVYTGLGRCGAILASQRIGLVPDVVCLGKILGGGLPLSACVGSRTVMDAWPPSPGEALHTSTFLGHPLACAAGTAVLERVSRGIPEASEALGSRLRTALAEGLDGVPGVRDVRGLGLLVGVELDPGHGVEATLELLREGVLVLPAGDRGEVVELSPPVVLTREQEAVAAEAVIRAVRTISGSA